MAFLASRASANRVFFVCHGVCLLCVKSCVRKRKKAGKFDNRPLKKPCKSVIYKALKVLPGIQISNYFMGDLIRLANLCA